jgi:hypothetical protein
MKDKVDEKKALPRPAPICGVINRGDVKPGDIILSVGTINPSFTEDFLREELDKYNKGSYDRLCPLLNPVKIGQYVVSRSRSGHNDSVHAGFCIGMDGNDIPIITDLYGHVQDMSIYQYYTPTTLRVFRPNIDSLLFERARERLLDSADERDKENWDNRRFSKTNLFYFPGRLESKWDQSITHSLKITFSPSNFFSVSGSVLEKTEREMICSKLVIETYKILLLQIAKYLNIKDEHSFIKNYMNLLDNSTPKTLEGYLIDNINYMQFIIPTETNLFDKIAEELKKEENLYSVYDELSEKLLVSGLDQYTKAVIFVNEAIKSGVSIPSRLDHLLKSQCIICSENNSPLNGPNKDDLIVDNGNGSHHELEWQYGEGKKLLDYIIHSEIMDSSEELRQLKENCKKQLERYETLQVYHENNKGKEQQINQTPCFIL